MTTTDTGQRPDQWEDVFLSCALGQPLDMSDWELPKVETERESETRCPQR